jgi:C4-dicarboxylate-specific signal transduction histidine kinase
VKWSDDEVTQKSSGGQPSSAVSPLIRHLHILRTVTAAVSRSLNLNEVIQKSLTALTRVTGHEMASLHLISADGQTLLLRGDRGFSQSLREVNLTLPVGQGLIGRVAMTGRVRRLDEVSKAADLLPAARAVVVADGIRGFVCVPIRARHRVLGTLSLGRRTPQPFTDEEVALLECTADQIGFALDNARLYSETRHQLEDLRRSHTELVKAERLAAVGELAGGVAHEINNPLMIILGQVHLLLQSQDSGEILNGLKVIDSAIKRAADIVRDLVLFAEHFPLHTSRCKVVDQINHVLAMHQPRLEVRHVAVRTEAKDSPEIWADAGQLQQVFFHLVQNAEQAMVAAHGGGTLTIRIGRTARGVRVDVADDGPGIPPDHLPRIFNPFFTTKAPGEGRGLGLSVAYSIVAEHDGRLWAENRPEGGAVFVVELPIGTPATRPAIGSSAASA